MRSQSHEPCGPQANSEDPFFAVFRAELDEIGNRRAVPPGSSDRLAGEGDSRVPSTRFGLVGLALSGGGIRSAAVCLGALQALASKEVDAIGKIDYLSTVSGGGYLAPALVAGLARKDFPFASQLGRPENKNLKKLRDFSNYLLVGGLRNTLPSIGSVVAGLIANIFIVLPILLICAGLTIWANPTQGDLGAAIPTFEFLNFLGLSGEFTYSRSILLLSALCGVVLLFATARLWWDRQWRIRLRVLWIVLILLPLGVAFLEFQPVAVRSYLSYVQQPSDGISDKDSLVGLVSGLAAAMTAFSAVFGRLLRDDGTARRGWRNALTKLRTFMLYLVAGLAVPFLIWLAYLALTSWGVMVSAPPGQVCHDGMAFAAPGWLRGFYCTLSRDFWPIGLVYIASGSAGILLWSVVPPNAYSLHSLYRDKLGRAFLRYYPDNDANAVLLSTRKLSGLDTMHAPYLLINAALNIHGSRKANERGRNADFFLFSKRFVGSRSTGWAETSEVEKVAPSLDLGTAVTVSGAAVSANVGANVNRALVFSLAMLNVRLGFWLPNVSRLKTRLDAFLANGWGPIWFLREAFGWLTGESRLVFLTDGGHIENLGLYALLRRRCRLIIVVDAEADPAMVMPSLVQVERFARIDLGIRIDIEWDRICQRTRQYDPAVPHRGPHAAAGIIHYDEDRADRNGEKGVLVYVKSSLSGDENDYISEYRRRYAAFPQEATMDQFFSEEQFEAYRALGFHMTQRLFLGADPVQGLSDDRDKFAAWVKQVLKDTLGLERDLAWTARSSPAPADQPAEEADPGAADRPAANWMRRRKAAFRRSRWPSA